MGISKGKKLVGSIQQLGQAMLVPVALLPAGGILYGVGMALKSETLTAVAPFLLSRTWTQIANMLSGAGSIIFGNLALLFAVGVAIGLAKNHDGTAGLAAVVGFLLMNQTINIILGIDADAMAAGGSMYQSVLGINTLRVGVFGGIFVGLIAAWAYNKFHTLKLPEYLGFFAAKRSVPIIVSVLSVLLGVVLCVIWPPIQSALDALSAFLIDKNPVFGVFTYAVVVKLLNPLGLHNAFVTPFQYQFGTYINATGDVITGDKAMFFAQLADGVKPTAGVFQNGTYVIDTLACIGIALAIYHEAKPENKKKVAGVLISATFTSFLTGITEPLLFSYLFVAPLCFVVYALFNGLAYVACYLLGVRLTATFAGGIIDFILIGVLNNAPNWYLVFPLAIVFGIAFYITFRFLIRKFNYKTLGREDEEDSSSLKEISMELSAYENAAGIVAALGGKDNITELTCCATRLRVTVKDDSIVKKDDFKKYGAKGLADYGKNLQIIIGTNVQNVLEDVQNVIAGIEVERTESVDWKPQTVVKFNEKIVAPVSGEIIPMSKVNDPAFSSGSLGGGFAVKPVDGTVCAPVAGTISMLFPTLHAFGITTEQGQDVLVHIGVGTVELKGEGFKALAKEGDKVAAGTPVVDVDLQKVSEKVSAMDVIVCFNDVEMENFKLKSSQNVKCKDIVKAVVK